MIFPSDLHSQRPEYQRVGIDLAHDYVRNYTLDSWGIVNSPFDKNNIHIRNLQNRAWFYRHSIDSIFISLWKSTNIYLFIHEFLHAFSSYQRTWCVLQYIGFDTEDNTWKTSSKNYWFNEGVTDSLARILYKKKESEILQYQEKYSEIQRRINALLKYEWKRVGTQRLYYGYKEEVDFIQVFVDTLCYIRIKWKDRDFEEERKKIWWELERAFFAWDIAWLESACHEIDTSWRLQDKIEISQPSDEVFWDLTQKLIAHTRESYNGLYIPTKL